jgi:hypothetical protein
MLTADTRYLVGESGGARFAPGNNYGRAYVNLDSELRLLGIHEQTKGMHLQGDRGRGRRRDSCKWEDVRFL